MSAIDYEPRRNLRESISALTEARRERDAAWVEVARLRAALSVTRKRLENMPVQMPDTRTAAEKFAACARCDDAEGGAEGTIYCADCLEWWREQYALEPKR